MIRTIVIGLLLTVGSIAMLCAACTFIGAHHSLADAALVFGGLFAICAPVYALIALFNREWAEDPCGLLWRLEQRRRLTRGSCLACNYDLTGNATGICSECGTKIRVSVRRGN